MEKSRGEERRMQRRQRDISIAIFLMGTSFGMFLSAMIIDVLERILG